MGVLGSIFGGALSFGLGPLGPALVGAGASLLGGALSQKAANKQAAQANAWELQAIKDQNEYNSPKNVRARAEEAGFNPLAFIGPGVGQQTSLPSYAMAGNYMGSAIADAGMAIADQMSKNRELARLEKLSEENRKLQEKVQNLTLRPKVPGVYGNAVSSDTSVVAGSSHFGHGVSSGATDSVTPPPMDRYNLYVEVYDPMTGRTVKLPNPDLMDAGPVETAWGMAQVGAADAVLNGVPKAKAALSAPWSMGSPMAGGIPFGQRYRNYSKKTYRFPKLEWPTGAPLSWGTQ